MASRASECPVYIHIHAFVTEGNIPSIPNTCSVRNPVPQSADRETQVMGSRNNFGFAGGAPRVESRYPPAQGRFVRRALMVRSLDEKQVVFLPVATLQLHEEK